MQRAESLDMPSGTQVLATPKEQKGRREENKEGG
jgi:hypothetical protein